MRSASPKPLVMTRSGALALAFQQRVGGHRGAHPDRLDPAGRDRLAGAEPEQRPDTGDGRVGVARRVLRQQLVRQQPAVRAAADDVGERAAAVDPELPPGWSCAGSNRTSSLDSMSPRCGRSRLRRHRSATDESGKNGWTRSAASERGARPYGGTVILPKVRDPRFITIRRGGTLMDSDHRLLALWAAACAGHVLHRFESAQPSDPRPRQAIERFGHGRKARSRCRSHAPRAAMRWLRHGC